MVEFLEPGTFDLATFTTMSGCGVGAIHAYGPTVIPGDRIPYSAVRHRVNEAWVRSTGRGITVGVVDTGVSGLQPQLLEQWDDGLSSGRVIGYNASDASAEPDRPWLDTCGHGTKILGVIGAPRDGRSIAGFAYGVNAYAVRAVDDPVALFGIWDEVRNGIDMAASNSSIINMAFETYGNYNSGVRNVVAYHYSQGDLFVGAAGSGGNNYDVVFPASLPDVVAVTGINPTSTYPNYQPCEGCYRNSVIEFSSWVGLETTGPNSAEDGVGTSSAATAQITAIAALVWSRYPTWTRDQVLARMRAAAPYTQKTNFIGYGPPDAMCATGGMCGASLGGPNSVTRGAAATFTAYHYVLDEAPPQRFTYQWSNGATTKSTRIANVCGPAGSTGTINVIITDTTDGTRYPRSFSYLITVARSTYVPTENMEIPGCSGTGS